MAFLSGAHRMKWLVTLVEVYGRPLPNTLVSLPAYLLQAPIYMMLKLRSQSAAAKSWLLKCS